MYKKIIYLKLFFFALFSFSSLANESQKFVDHDLTNLLAPNWPYEAFLAIPRIAEMKPTLAIEISAEDRILQSVTCVELFHLELRKSFDPKAILDRESLHKLLCKGMKRAINKTDISRIVSTLAGAHSVALSFDFFNGFIRVVEMPYPPLNPTRNLENVFLGESEVLNFGDIDFPKEIELEINETPL